MSQEHLKDEKKDDTKEDEERLLIAREKIKEAYARFGMEFNEKVIVRYHRLS